jgi:hypothetical protein
MSEERESIDGWVIVLAHGMKMVGKPVVAGGGLYRRLDPVFDLRIELAQQVDPATGLPAKDAAGNQVPPGYRYTVWPVALLGVSSIPHPRGIEISIESIGPSIRACIEKALPEARARLEELRGELLSPRPPEPPKPRLAIVGANHPVHREPGARK